MFINATKIISNKILRIETDHLYPRYGNFFTSFKTVSLVYENWSPSNCFCFKRNDWLNCPSIRSKNFFSFSETKQKNEIYIFSE